MTASVLSSRLREKIAAAQRGSGPLHALFLKLDDVDSAVALGLAGIDVVILDLEHSQIREQSARRICTELAAIGIPCLIRLAEVSRGTINRLLEAGAAGIQLSTTTSAAQVEALRAAALYPPRGQRSFSLAHRQADYGTSDRDAYLRREAAGPLLVVQLETARLRSPLAKIVSAGVDLVFIGVEDLRLSCSTDELDAERIVRDIAAEADRHGVPWGCYASLGEAPHRATQGATLLATGSDIGLLARAARAHVEQFAAQTADS